MILSKMYSPDDLQFKIIFLAMVINNQSKGMNNQLICSSGILL